MLPVYFRARQRYLYRIFQTIRRTGLKDAISMNRSIFIHKAHQIIRRIKRNKFLLETLFGLLYLVN